MIYNYQGNGIIFGLSSLEESITYDYTNPSNLVFTIEDYGVITELHVEFLDYGNLSPAAEGEDAGSIIVFETVQPFGGLTISGLPTTEKFTTDAGESTQLFIISGVAKIPLLATWIGFGSLDISGSALEAYSAQTPEDTQLFSISGSALEAYSAQTPEDSVLYTFSGSALERFTADTPENTQLFIISGSALEKETDSYFGFGSLDISGSALEKETDSYFGTGTPTLSGSALEAYSAQTPEDSVLYTFSGSALERFTADTPENTQLFIISGSALEKETDSYFGFGSLDISGSALEKETDSYFGFGSLFSFGEKLESRTFVYDETSILSYDLLDYGFVDQQTDQFDEDYGSISNPANTNIDNGIIVGFGATETIFPFGNLEISGSLVEKETDSYIGFGSLDISGSLVEKETDSYFGTGTPTLSGSALEAYSAQTPEDTQLFSISGSALEAYSAQTPEDSVLYTFSGSALERFTADTPENTQLFIISGSALEKETDSYFGFGSLDISGSALEKETDSYIGFGSLDISGSALEAYSAQTPEDSVLYTFFGSLVEKETDSYIGFGSLDISGSALEKETDSYFGTGTPTLSGSALEAYSAQTPEDTQLFSISGSALEAYSAQTPEDTQLFSIFGSALERFTADTPENTQLFIISGSALEKETDSYFGFGSLDISGELVHPDVRYIPHYGIEKNIGIGTTGIQLFGAVDDSAQRLAKGFGSIFVVNGFSPQESYPWLPEPGIGRSWSFTKSTYVGTGTARFGLLSNRTYSPIYPRNAIPGDPGSGIGTIRINDDVGLTITRAVLPYNAKGEILVSGIGLESFAIVNYNGSGSFIFSGISSNREINVYQDYDTSGVIIISQQTQSIIEKNTESYIGLGTLTFSGSALEKETDSYFGTGTPTLSGSTLEAYSAQTPEDTQLFSISGSALEAYSAQTPEDSVLYEFDGNLIESRTYADEGFGQATFGSDALVIFERRVIGLGLLRFITHLSDNLYDTCDSVDITSDYENSAFVSFTANPPKSTQLFSILGSASTNEINAYEYVGVGNLTFSGSLVERETNSHAGIGTLFTFSGGNEVDVNSYKGSGSLFVISGSSESKSSQTPENTILVNIFGTAFTKLESEYSYSGIITAYINGSAFAVIESNYSYSGVGLITLSGELVHPDIQFIPAFKSSGLFSISGISSNSISRIGVLSGNRNLFAFSDGFESFSKSTYIGLGTIYIPEVSSIAINNSFQIPRTYVVII